MLSVSFCKMNQVLKKTFELLNLLSEVYWHKYVPYIFKEIAFPLNNLVQISPYTLVGYHTPSNCNNRDLVIVPRTLNSSETMYNMLN